MILLELFIGFLEIGCFSFGGAYGAIPLIREVVLYYGWIEEDKLSYMIAVSESTPGPIMVNLATYIGSTTAGIPGAIIATITVVLPAFLIVLLLILLLKKMLSNIVFQSIFGALKACVAGIVLATGVYIILKNCVGDFSNISFDIPTIFLMVSLSALYFISKKIIKNGLSPIVFICITGLIGVLVYGW